MSKKTVVLLTLVLNIPVLIFAQTDSSDYLTITTYYPSPYGVYGTLKLQPKPRPVTCREGEMTYDSNDPRGLYYCNETNAWQPIGGGAGYWVENATTHNIYNTNSGPSVGIGTTAPRQKGSGAGYLDAKDVWVRDAAGGGAWISDNRIIGTFETFFQEGSGTYMGCKYNWGAARCSPPGCNRGTRTDLMSATDHVGNGEIPGWGPTDAHVKLEGCIQD